MILQTSKRLYSQQTMSRPVQRVAQVRRHLSTSPIARGEIRDAYILSAARTPVGKVDVFGTLVRITQLTQSSLMAR